MMTPLWSGGRHVAAFMSILRVGPPSSSRFLLPVRPFFSVLGQAPRPEEVAMSRIGRRLEELGVALPEPPRPIAAYVPAVRSGTLVFVSGQVPVRDGALVAAGPVESAVSLENAREAARLCAVNALAVLAGALDGELDRVRRIVRVGVFVCCDPGFTGHSKVADGASELLAEVFGEAGRHARAALGAPSLPLGATVELELVAEAG